MVYGDLRRCITYRSTRRRCVANSGSLVWLGAGFRQAVRPLQENFISTITPFTKRYPVLTYFALVLVISEVPLVTYNLVFAAALWGVVAKVAVAYRGQISRQPLRRTVACRG